MKFRDSYMGTKMLLIIMVLCAFTLTACSSSNDNTSAPIETAMTEEISPTETENPRDADIAVQPYLEYAATDETIGSVTYYSGGLSFSQDHEDFEYGSEDIALMMSQYEGDVSTASATDLGNYTFYAVSTPRWSNLDYFIANKGESIDNAFALMQHPDLSLEDAIVNDSGDVFLFLSFEVFCASDNGVGYFETIERKLSANKEYMVIENNNSTSCPNNGFEYFLYNFDNMECYVVSAPEDAFVSRYTTFSNFIVGDNGQFVICDGPLPGVGTEWDEYDDTGYQMYVTGYGAMNMYRANFAGIPFYVSNDYIVFSDKYSLYKYDSSANSTELLKYADFSEPFYTTTFTFYKDLHSGPGQIIFSEDSIGDGDSVYIYDCIALKLSNGMFVADKNNSGYTAVGDFVITE